MKKRNPLAVFVLLCLAWVAQLSATAQPVVSNVRASQRAGTQLVDIYYDLTSGSNALAVYVQVSTNGGATYSLPAYTFTGAVGVGIAPGLNQKITWNAGQDWPTNFSSNVRFRVTADDANAPSGMSLIPAGSFTMGDNLGDGAAAGWTDEVPLHTVYVSAFYMDKYDVTEALWAQVYNWAVTHGYSFDSPGLVWNNFNYSKGPNYPVVYVGWYDVVKWCNARSEIAGKPPAYYTDASQTVVYRTGDLDISNSWVNWNAGYRLPTEAEWEKAARGGLSGQRFPWGNTINESLANYFAFPLALNLNGYAYDMNSYSGYNTNFTTGNTHESPVNAFAPNGYGLYDMSGSVWQWCWDRCGSYGSASQTDPRGPTIGLFRVNRGGSYADYAFNCRSAFRNGGYPANYIYDRFYYSYYGIGFRCVLPPDQ